MQNDLTVAFDADDTLWHNEHAFAAAEEAFNDLVSAWADPEHAQSVLVDVERQNVERYGYGVKSFALSMIAAACKISDDTISAAHLRTIVDMADELLDMATELIDDAASVVEAVAAKYRTMIITKGDLHHQLRRLATTDVQQHCFDIEVVAEKDAATYARILRRHRIEPDRFVMIGNSIPSDVAPVLELGGFAIHIPYDVTWALEVAAVEPEPSPRWAKAPSIAEVPQLLERFGF